MLAIVQGRGREGGELVRARDSLKGTVVTQPKSTWKFRPNIAKSNLPRNIILNDGS